MLLAGVLILEDGVWSSPPFKEIDVPSPKERRAVLGLLICNEVELTEDRLLEED